MIHTPHFIREHLGILYLGLLLVSPLIVAAIQKKKRATMIITFGYIAYGILIGASLFRGGDQDNALGELLAILGIPILGIISVIAFISERNHVTVGEDYHAN